MLEEFEFGLHGRDFPSQLFVLDDELLEEGDYAFVMLVRFHVSENGACQTDIPTAARLRRKGAELSPEGKGGGLKA